MASDLGWNFWSEFGSSTYQYALRAMTKENPCPITACPITALFEEFW
jgi:hypothetical protein